MIPSSSSLKNRQEKQLIDNFSSLNSEDKTSLLAFAEFLSKRGINNNKATNKITISEPVPIKRPETESVIKAIKRLTKTYPMVEKEQFLHSISDLMTAHLMQGKDSISVIDELESLFFNAYKKLE